MFDASGGCGVANAAKTNVARLSSVGFSSIDVPHLWQFDALLSYLHYNLILLLLLSVLFMSTVDSKQGQERKTKERRFISPIDSVTPVFGWLMDTRLFSFLFTLF